MGARLRAVVFAFAGASLLMSWGCASSRSLEQEASVLVDAMNIPDETLARSRFAIAGKMMDKKINATVYSNLGLIHKEKGDIPGAVVLFLNAIHEDPKFASAYFNLGDIALRSGRGELAQKFFLLALHANPDHKPTLAAMDRLKRG